MRDFFKRFIGSIVNYRAIKKLKASMEVEQDTAALRKLQQCLNELYTEPVTFYTSTREQGERFMRLCIGGFTLFCEFGARYGDWRSIGIGASNSEERVISLSLWKYYIYVSSENLGPMLVVYAALLSLLGWLWWPLAVLAGLFILTPEIDVLRAKDKRHYLEWTSDISISNEAATLRLWSEDTGMLDYYVRRSELTKPWFIKQDRCLFYSWETILGHETKRVLEEWYLNVPMKDVYKGIDVNANVTVTIYEVNTRWSTGFVGRIETVVVPESLGKLPFVHGKGENGWDCDDEISASNISCPYDGFNSAVPFTFFNVVKGLLFGKVVAPYPVTNDLNAIFEAATSNLRESIERSIERRGLAFSPNHTVTTWDIAAMKGMFVDVPVKSFVANNIPIYLQPNVKGERLLWDLRTHMAIKDNRIAIVKPTDKQLAEAGSCMLGFAHYSEEQLVGISKFETKYHFGTEEATSFAGIGTLLKDKVADLNLDEYEVRLIPPYRYNENGEKVIVLPERGLLAFLLKKGTAIKKSKRKDSPKVTPQCDANIRITSSPHLD